MELRIHAKAHNQNVAPRLEIVQEEGVAQLMTSLRSLFLASPCTLVAVGRSTGYPLPISAAH